MKKVNLRSMVCVTMLLGTLSVSATQYCHEALTKGDNTVYLSAEMPTDGNYVLTIEADVEMTGLGGSFMTLSDGNHDLREFLKISDDKRVFTVTFSSASAPTFYTPLYVLMPVEVAYQWPNDIEWGVCGGSDYVPTGKFGEVDNYGHLITFTQIAAKGSLNDSVFKANGFEIKVVDTDNSKLEIDANNQYFGTVKGAFQLNYRLKSGGPSSDKNALKGVAPEDGTLIVYARSASGTATDRTLVIAQGAETLYNKVVEDGQAVTAVKPGTEKNDTVKIFPIVEVAVKKGDFDIAYPVNSLNFYGFDFKGTPKEAPEIAAPAPAQPQEQVFSFYSDAYTPGVNVNFYFQDWGSGSTFEEQAIGEDHFQKITANNYCGIHLLTDVDHSSLNISNMEYIHFDVWAKEDMTFKFGPVWVGGERVNSVSVKGGKWNQFDVPISAYTGFDGTTIRQFKLDGFGGKKVIYLDNIYAYTTKEVADDEAPTGVTATMESASYFSVTLALKATDNSGIVNFDVMSGETKLTSIGGSSDKQVSAVVGGLLPNTEYNLTVIASDPKGNKAEAVAVSAKTLEAPTAAPAPTIEAENVKAIYSDAYEVVVPAGFNKNDNWWAPPQMVEGELAEGNRALYYYGFTDGMIGWTFGAEADATGFNYLYVDIYPAGQGTIEIYPVVEGQEEAAYHKTSKVLKANEWNTIVLNYSGLDLSKVKQMGWISYYTLKSFFVDNVYFSNVAPVETAVEDVRMSQNVQKIVEDGVVYIVRDGVRYNMLGVQVK